MPVLKKPAYDYSALLKEYNVRECVYVENCFDDPVPDVAMMSKIETLRYLKTIISKDEFEKLKFIEFEIKRLWYEMLGLIDSD